MIPNKNTLAPAKADPATAAELRALVNELAQEAGFDLVAVSDARQFSADRAEALRRINAGLMDGLPWFTESRIIRGTDPDALLPGARSIISLGLNYYSDTEDDDADALSPAAGQVARYARGRDYHRVMKRRMRRIVLSLSEHPALQRTDDNLAARWFVDDGPMLDRAVAARAGLGWFGKNGNILTPRLGSWILLGQIVTNLRLTPDAPLAKTCGSCVRCLPACPTGAIVAPYVVDNRRCISYLTIENRGAIPIELRAGVGTWVFGCDLCQEVCPVNRKAMATGDPNFGRRDLAAVDLIELLAMTEPEFRQRFAGTPLMRAQWVGMQRNACVALGQHRRCRRSSRPRPLPGLSAAPGPAARRLGAGTHRRPASAPDAARRTGVGKRSGRSVGDRPGAGCRLIPVVPRRIGLRRAGRPPRWSPPRRIIAPVAPSGSPAQGAGGLAGLGLLRARFRGFGFRSGVRLRRVGRTAGPGASGAGGVPFRVAAPAFPQRSDALGLRLQLLFNLVQGYFAPIAQLEHLRFQQEEIAL